MLVPPLLNPRRWSESTSQEATKKLDGVWRFHYSRLTWDTTLESPGTILSSPLFLGVASHVSAMKGALLVVSQHSAQPEQRKSFPHPWETLILHSWTLNCPPACPTDKATTLTCIGSIARNCRLLLRRDHQGVGWNLEDICALLK